MWLQWSLCLLYMLQVVLLSGMVTGYLYGISQAQPSAPQASPQVPQFEESSPGHGRVKISNTKPSVKMKPIPLSYLRENLSRVSSRLELVRLFTDSEIDDHQLSRWISRTIRSVTHSTSHGLKLNQLPRQHNEELTKHAGQGHNVDQMSKQKDKLSTFVIGSSGHIPRKVEAVPAANDAVDIEQADAPDYYFDYAQDEPTQGDLEAFEAALYHIDEMNTCSSSKCKHPMPFVQNVRDPHDRTRVFFPECVVLHRCMNHTGCCADGNHECVPISMSIITRAFLMVDRHSAHDDFVMFNPNMATTITFVNHTECECREKPKLPKCTKLCPKPFRLTQEGTGCRCDCFPVAYQDSWPCESVKEGVVPLSHDELVCIKNSNCYIPDCAVGEFEIKTGLCPLSDEYALPAFLFQNPDERRFYREHLRSYDFSNPQTKYTGSIKDFTTRGTLPDHSADRSHTREEKLELLEPSSLSPAKLSTARSTIKQSHPSSGAEAKATHSVHDTQDVSENDYAFSHDNAKIQTAKNEKGPNISSAPSSSDNPTHVMEDWHGRSGGYVTVATFNDENINNSDVHEKFPTNNVTDMLNKSSSVTEAETAEILEDTSKTTVDNVHGVDISYEAIDSVDKSNESAPLISSKKSIAPKATPQSEDKFDSSSQDINKQGYKKPSAEAKDRAGDDTTRRSALKNNFKFQFSSHHFHENHRSVGVPSKSHSLEHQTLANFLKPLPNATPTPSSKYSSQTDSLSLPQTTSSSSGTASSHLLTPSPHPAAGDSKTFKQTMQRDQEYPEMSNDKFQIEDKFSYDYDIVDGSGEEFD